LPNALSSLQSGGFLIADGCNHRVRRVSPDGRITTVAGRGDPGLDGDGGPATSAAIGTPISVQALADGGFVIGVEDADHRRGAVRAVAADGRITTLARFAAGSIAVLPDGDLVLARKAPRALLATTIVRLSPDGTARAIAGSGRNPRATVAPALSFDGDTEPARANGASITDLSVDQEGDVLYTDSGNETSGIGGRVRLLPTGHTMRLALGIKPATLRSSQRVRVAFALTRQAVVTAELRRGTHVLGRVATSAESLRQTLRFAFAVAPGRYEIRVIARTNVAPRQEAVDRITVFPGGVLTPRRRGASSIPACETPIRTVPDSSRRTAATPSAHDAWTAQSPPRASVSTSTPSGSTATGRSANTPTAMTRRDVASRRARTSVTRRRRAFPEQDRTTGASCVDMRRR
jgi:hypothetical protein